MQTREQLSETLLRTGTELALERVEMTRRMAADASRPGYDRAVAAMAAAQWVESAILWLAWRLRPRRTLVAELD